MRQYNTVAGSSALAAKDIVWPELVNRPSRIAIKRIHQVSCIVQYHTCTAIVAGVVLIQARDAHDRRPRPLHTVQQRHGVRIGQVARVVGGIPDFNRIDAVTDTRRHTIAGQDRMSQNRQTGGIGDLAPKSSSV